MASFVRPVRSFGVALGLVVVAACMWFSVAAAQPPGRAPSDTQLGLSVNDAKAYQGYTLLTPMNSTSTYLVDVEGRVINTWKSDYRPGLSAYLLENGHLLRTGAEHNGSIGGAGIGGRVQEFSWEGELLWDFSFSTERNHPHHDICPMPGGNVLIITWDRKTPEEAVAAGRQPGTVRGQFLPDCIFEIRPTGRTTGEIVWEWHAWDHLIQDVDKTKPNYGDVSEHPELIDVNYGLGVMAAMLNDPDKLAKLRSLGYVGGGQPGAAGSGPGRGGPGPRGGPHMEPDWMHTNSVAYNPELDQIMLSIHEFSEIWIIDHGTTTAEAASHSGGRRGKGGDLLYRWGNPRAYRNGTNVDQRLFAQHCAHWIPKGLPGEGHVLLFNNGNGRPDGMYSTVDEIVLPLTEDGLYAREEYLAFGPERAVWSYSAPDKASLFSMTVSGAQRLPNGDTLICDGNSAVVFEATPKKEIVWKYAMSSHGPGGPGGPGGMRPGELFPPFLQDMLQLADEQKAKLDKLQQQVAADVEKLLTEEPRNRLRQPMGFGGGGPRDGRRTGDRDGQGNSPNGRGGPGDFGRPGGPRGFTPPRPGEVIPSTVVESLDLSKKQKAELARLQKRVDYQVGKILTKDQKATLAQMQQGLAGGPGVGPPGFGRPGFGPPGFGPPGGGRRGFGPRNGDANGLGGSPRSQGRPATDNRDSPRGFGGSDRPGLAGTDGGPGGPDGRPGGPRGGPGGGGGGLFTAYRFGPDYPGLVGKDLTPGEKLEDLVAGNEGPEKARPDTTISTDTHSRRGLD